MGTEDTTSRLVTPAELAERWRCSRAHVYKLMAQGLPSVNLGRSRRIRLRDAEAFLDAATARQEGVPR